LERINAVEQHLDFFVDHFFNEILDFLVCHGSPPLRSDPRLQAAGQQLRQSGFPDFFLGLGHVIGKTVETDLHLAGVEDDVAGSRVLVARLADGTRVDQVTGVGVELDAGVLGQGDDVELFVAQVLNYR
jgi:hypothetical protein